MTVEKFLLEVLEMRRLQKAYFKTRSSKILAAAKAKESLIDKELQELENYKYNPQQKLFDAK